MSTLTGENLYYAFNEQDCDAVPWSAVSRDIQDLHVCAAAIVQQTHIQPLQDLVMALQQLARDWQRYAQAEDELVAGAEHFHEELDVLKAEHANLKQRTRALAGEEVNK